MSVGPLPHTKQICLEINVESVLLLNFVISAPARFIVEHSTLWLTPSTRLSMSSSLFVYVVACSQSVSSSIIYSALDLFLITFHVFKISLLEFPDGYRRIWKNNHICVISQLIIVGRFIWTEDEDYSSVGWDYWAKIIKPTLCAMWQVTLSLVVDIVIGRRHCHWQVMLPLPLNFFGPLLFIYNTVTRIYLPQIPILLYTHF